MPTDINVVHKRIEMGKPASIDVALPSGLDLVRQICNDALKSIARRQLQTSGALDDDTIKSVKDLGVTLMDIEKSERDRKRFDKFSDKLGAMTEAELLEIINGK